MTESDRKRLRELVSNMCDRSLDANEMRVLEELIISDEQAVEEAVRLLEVNAALTHPASDVIEILSQSNELVSRMAGGDESPSQFRSTPGSSVRSWAILALAATLLAVCTSWVTWQFASTGDSNDGTIAVANQPPSEDSTASSEAAQVSTSTERVARIIRKIDCGWEDDRWAIQSSADILADQTVSMKQGLMELKFTSGARITLQGPASMTVVSPMSVILFHGRMTADVPDSAHGFTVRTPSGQAVDLGTRFGLDVSEQGLTEAHVFEGEVVVRDALNSGSDSKPIHLTENMAYRFGDSSSVSELEAQPNRFIDLSFSEAESRVELPAVAEGLKLRLTADSHVQTDAQQRVSVWRHTSSKNDESLAAWQVRPKNRPKLVPNAFGEKPGIHFNGNSYLVTDPLPLPADLTACVVFKFNALEVSRHPTTWPQGYQLLNFNGPSTMVLKMNKNHHLCGLMYAGVTIGEDGTETHVKSGVSWTDALQENVPHLAVYVNDTAKDTGRLYVDGTLIGEKPCDVDKHTEVPRFIGSHNHMWQPRFVGHMAEILVYERAIGEEEVQVVSQSLMQKYGISE